MADKAALEFKNTVSVDEAAGFVDLIAKSLREGSLLLESGDQSLGVQFSPEVRVVLEAKQSAKDGSGSLQLELKWEGPGEEEGPAPTLELVPGAIAPAVAEEEEAAV